MLQKELAKRLRSRFETEIDDEGWLMVSSGKMPLCRVKYNGSWIVNDNPYLSDEYLGKIAGVQNELLTVREYISLYEHAPQMKAADASEYRQLVSFGHTVLAAKYSEHYGFKFVTWKQTADSRAVFRGDYSPSYEYAKESFAVRSGLIPKCRLFTEQEAADIYRCVDFTKCSCETLTYDQERQLDRLEEKLVDGYPSLEANPPAFEHSTEPQQNM